MSYEGYREFKCKCGGDTAADVYDKQPEKCPSCGGRFYRVRSIDQTNGHHALPWRDVEYRPEFGDYVLKGVYAGAEWHGPPDT